MSVPVVRKGFVYYTKKFALIYGAGSITASQAVQHGVFVLPPALTLYIIYTLSFISLVCIILAGPALVSMMKKFGAVYQELQKLNNEKPDA